MADLVFDPQKSPDTATAVMAALLAKWAALPPAMQQEIDERRQRLAGELLALKDYQRPLKLIEFLQWLEAVPAAATVAAAELKAGKGPLRRSGFVRVDDSRTEQLQAALTAPAPVTGGGSTPSPVVEVTFFVQVEFPATAYTNTPTPCLVRLTQVEPPANQNAGQVVLAFTDLQVPLPVTVTLTAPHFTEQTGDWTRTIQVESAADSWPAVFLLTTTANVGETGLLFDFANAWGRVVRRVMIAAPSKNPFRQAEPQAAAQPGAAVEYFTRVVFPGQIRPQDEQPLIVQLTLTALAESIVAERTQFHFVDSRKPEFVEVVITAPGMTERTGSWRRLIRLYSQSDSQPAVFLLKAGTNVGTEPVAIDFYHQGRLLLATGFTTEVTRQIAPQPQPPQMKPGSTQIEPLPDQPLPAPDLELRIVFDPPTNLLTFKLHSPLPAVGYQRQEMGSVRLNSNPRQFLEGKLEALNQFARQTADQLTTADLEQISDEIKTIGQELFEELFSPELRQEYWRIKTLRETGVIKTLQLISDEPWIPWELVKPYGFDQQNNEQSDGYLAEVFQLCRWLAGRGPAPGVQVTAAALVSSQSDLAFVEQEEQYFANLKTRGISVGEPLRTRSAVLQLTKSGATQVLHLAAHGNFNAQNADDSELILEDEALRPSDLSGERSAALRRHRPLVFLNVCHGAQADFSLTGLGGWADKLIGIIGVSAFVGALWEIHDELAAQFATHFYDNLMAGQTLSAACHAARLLIREREPANPTWLAYTLYADPNAKVTWGKKA